MDAGSAEPAEYESPSKALVAVVMVSITVGLGVLGAVVANNLLTPTSTPAQIAVQGPVPEAPASAPSVVRPASQIAAHI